jgi:hypothetical protein
MSTAEKRWPGMQDETFPDVFNINAMPPQPTEKKPGQLPEKMIRQFFEEVGVYAYRLAFIIILVAVIVIVVVVVVVIIVIIIIIIGLVIALRPQTSKHIRGGWSHYTDTSEPVDGGVL